MKFKSNHTICDQIGDKVQCVEIFLDGRMQLVNMSEPYDFSDDMQPVVHVDGYLKEVRRLSELTPEEIQRFTHTGPPPEGMTPSEIREREMEENGEPGCSSCAEKAKQKKAGLLKRLAKGVPGLLKSELGIDQADPQEIDRRKTVCQGCPDGIYDFGVCSEERGGCGCFLASKVTIKGESCPKGHW
jgi:hypothetical protein